MNSTVKPRTSTPQQPSAPAPAHAENSARLSTRPANAPDAASTDHDQIARLAYEIYLKNGRQPGQCRENWQQAQRELERQKSPAGYPEAQESPSPGRTGTEPTASGKEKRP